MRAKLLFVVACVVVLPIACADEDEAPVGVLWVVSDEHCPAGTIAVPFGGGFRCIDPSNPTPLSHEKSEDNWFCQGTDEACEIYCSEAERCGIRASGPVCLAACKDDEIFWAHSNIAHACVSEEGCAFFEGSSPCVKRKQQASTYECSGESITVCDEEGCCFHRSCEDACASADLASKGCEHSPERGHDACLCAAD